MESRNPTLMRILEENESVIENRHSGIPTMIQEMKRYGLPFPEFYEERDSFKVIFRNISVAEAPQQATQNNNYEEIRNKVVEFCKEPKTSDEIRKYIGIETTSFLSRNIIKPLIASKKLDYTNKKSINAKNQKFISL